MEEGDAEGDGDCGREEVTEKGERKVNPPASNFLS